MLRTIRLWSGVLLISTFLASTITAQARPAQFKGDVKMKGADGTNATGVMYFGGAKVRTELSMDGQNVILLADPAAQSQFVLMPDEKMYMQMPLGQGPISVPISGPTDPTNPCSGGSGATDCVKGAVESINGHSAVRWDYTSQDGVRTRAWVSTKLRFPVKTTDDNGASMELSNIAEGVQPATLFAIPAGYTKMDMGLMGSMGAARGRGGRGNSGDPIATARSNMPPDMAAAMAAAMRGEGPKPKEAAGPTGSAWEKGKGWILSVTVAGNATTKTTTQGDPMRGTHYKTMTDESSFSVKLIASAPLNHVSPAAGVPGTPGPQWIHMPGVPGIGLPEAEKLPVSLSVTSQSVGKSNWTSDCRVVLDQRMPPGTATTTMKGTAQFSVPTTAISGEQRAQIVFKLSSDLKSYELLVGFEGNGGQVKEVTQTHTQTTGCDDKKVSVDDKSQTRDVSYGIPTIELKGLPLPATVSTVTGSKTMPLKLGGREMDATVTWTLTPIR